MISDILYVRLYIMEIIVLPILFLSVSCAKSGIATSAKVYYVTLINVLTHVY